MAELPTPAGALKSGREWRLIVALFVGVVVILGGAYGWFLSGDYVELVRSVRPEEAATIVEELKKEDVPFKLADGGGTILVPASKLDAARLDVSSKDLPLKGTVGFELFNQSDMGLTDFAQKVNYQRALQGELERTIMAMDGIAYARVHIAIPERSLFRESRSEARAAVTLTPDAGTTIDSDRIAGIQRLVAATVPELALDQVAVLNERGELLTPEFTDVADAGSSRTALEQNYLQRVSEAIVATAPRAAINVKLTTLPRTSVAEPTSSPTATRDHLIRVVLFERAPLSKADEDAIRQAIATELALDPQAGDSLQFSPAPEMAPTEVTESVGPAPVKPQVADANTDLMAGLERNWTIALSLLAVAATAGAVLVYQNLQRRRRAHLIERIRSELLLAGPTRA